jgi:cytochrome c556
MNWRRQNIAYTISLDPKIQVLEPSMKHKHSALTSYLTALLLGMSSLALPAHAQFAKAEDAIKYRKSALSVMGTHFGRVAAMAGGRAPYDAKAAADNAAIAETMSKLPWTAFQDGSDKGDTKAKPEIWSDKARFAEAAEKMQAEMIKLNLAARVGTLDALKPAVSSVAGTCKNCHDNFRQ